MKNKLLIYFLVILITMISFNYDVYARIHEADFKNLNDYFSSNSACVNNSDSCKGNPEYKFYLKMYDLYYLYKSKYKVKLDLPLIMSTLFYNNDQMITVFKMNLSDYDRKTIVESDWNPSSTTELDWDYDYESKDNYLVSNDSSMDMQVLAKNMVSKTTNEKCVKDGKTTKSKDVKDTEEDLKCDEGESLEKGNSTYKLDMDKYDDFLLEYIEKKYYLGRVTKNPVQSNGPDYVNHGIKPSVAGHSSSNSSGNSSGTPKPLSPTGSVTIDKLNKIAIGEEGNTGSKYWGSRPDNWCGFFVSWLYSNTDGKYIVPSGGAGSIPRDSVAAGLGVWLEDELTDSSTVPKAGDLILFNPTIYPTDKYTSSHIGYVYDVDDNKVYTVEGNSDTYDFSTSHVTLKSYDRKNSNINGYYRPNY